MIVRHVRVRNFRGIKSLDWHVGGRIVCLIGPGDSTKTTILDAIEFALAPRWYIPFSDADFHQARTENAINIEVTVGELPEELMSEDRAGLYLRGYRDKQPIHDDPDDGWEPVITVRLQVGADLEPRWEVVKESQPDARPFSWRDRERLNVARLGDDVEKHLTWSRGSALSRMTGDRSGAAPTLAIANRAAHKAIAEAPLEDLQKAAEAARTAAVAFGVNIPALRPGLDVQSFSVGSGALALQDLNGVPLRATGLGTRRLAALAVQQTGLGRQAIILIDEIESALEPHRIRRLLRKLSLDRSSSPTSGETPGGEGQVIMTTHSPTAVVALPVANLAFVQSASGTTTVESVAPPLQDAVQSIVRRLGHALLARKIIVCEGKTEEALCRVMDDVLAGGHEGQNFACFGVVPVNGEGRNRGPECALEFRRLGYDVAYLGDSDAPISPDRQQLENCGVHVVLWEGGVSTEERIALDLPWEALQDLVNAAIEEHTEQAVLSGISSSLGRPVVGLGSRLDSWVANGSSEAEIRTALGKAAKLAKNGWFKKLDSGETLGRIVFQALPKIPQAPLASSLNLLESWIYAE
jgi:hypothetical protein